MAEADPWRIDEIRDLENEVQEAYIKRNPDWKDRKWQLPTMFQGREYKDGERPMTPIDKVVDWAKTTHGGNQYELIYTGEPGCRMWGLCDFGPKEEQDE